MIETVRVATESLAAAKKLVFRTDVVKGLPYGLGDEPRLTQVVLNLVGNAIKFTDAGELCISGDAKNGSFVVSVSDTGPGIPGGELERIFDKFHQVDITSTKTKGGTWPRMGGVERRPRLDFPHGVTCACSSLRGSRLTHRILVVEDQEDLREIARLALEGAGYEVVEAATGAEGFAGTLTGTCA